MTRLSHAPRRVPVLSVVALALLVSGCFVSEARKQEADAKAQAAYAQCERLREAGKFPTHLAAVECAVPTVVAAYEESAYPFTDLIYVSVQARRIGARNLDLGDVTEAQYRHDLAELDARLAAEDARRREDMKFGGSPKPTPADVLVKGLPSFAPTPAAGALPSPPPAADAGCVPLGGIRRCN